MRRRILLFFSKSCQWALGLVFGFCSTNTRFISFHKNSNNSSTFILSLAEVSKTWHSKQNNEKRIFPNKMHFQNSHHVVIFMVNKDKGRKICSLSFGEFWTWPKPHEKKSKLQAVTSHGPTNLSCWRNKFVPWHQNKRTRKVWNKRCFLTLTMWPRP